MQVPLTAGVRLQPGVCARPEPTEGVCGGAGREKGAAVSSFQWCTDAFSLIKDKPQGNEGSGGGHGNLIRALGCSGRSCEFSESGNDVTPSSSFLSAPGKAATEKQ